MYHILEQNNGQPIIFWLSKNSLHKYIINAGRVINNGILLKDINSDFKLYTSISPNYISYQSVDSSTVICQLTQTSINEVFISKSTSTILEYKNKLFVFYIVAKDNKYSLFVSTSNDDFKSKILIFNDMDFAPNLLSVEYNDSIVLFCGKKLLFLSSDFKIITTFNFSSSESSNTVNLQNEVSQLKYELHQLEQHHNDFVKEYEELSAYTGELQEKLRKMRLKI